ncbi:hypothetical protein [Paenibacillus tianjinensis]|uniref:IrrE N-terminal-like domain-containing protein n=1 Tax=Paenibacillus tianjinensis TaxID=2810347 RepID=A0ABX7LA38_9BACL|nr:hypothetical protein [Paenibacillus tianjinensis]QSF43300.1 hypothetical protein JRJ22_18710 [Paenibacillus tianjinensis]
MTLKNTEIFYRYNIGLDKKHLIELVLNRFKLPEKGIAVIIDSEDYNSDYYRGTWDSYGLHLNLKNGIEELSPEFPLKIMNSRNYSTLVWLSRKASENRYALIWMLSHELRHYYQESISDSISKCGNFLYNTMGIVDKNFTYMDLPHEVDCELFAYNTLKDLTSEIEAEAYLQELIAKQPSYIKLKYLDVYLFVDEMICTLEKYKDDLNLIQIRSGDIIIRNFDIENEIIKLKGVSEKSQC